MSTARQVTEQRGATSHQKRRLRCFVVVLALLALAGCWLLYNRFDPSAGSGLKAIAVVHPDVSNSEAGVRAHIAETRGAVDRAVATNGPASSRAAAWMQLGQVYFAYEFYPAAAGCFTNAVALQTTNAQCWYALAESRLEMADVQGALTAMQEALHRTNSKEESNHCHRFIGDTLERLGRTAEAIREFEKVLTKQPDDVYSLIKVGRLAAQSGDSPRAVAVLELAQKFAPQRHEIASLLAQEYRKSGRNELADATLQALQSVDQTRKVQILARPDAWRTATKALDRSSIALHSRGVAAMNAGYFAQAVNAFEAALRADAKHIPTRVNLAFCRLELGEVIAAGDLFLSTLNEEPSNEMARKGLALALARSGRADDGLRFCSMWQAEKTNAALAVRTEAEIRMIQKDYKGAAAAYQRLTSLEPSDVVGPMGLAMAQAGQGLYDASRDTLESALQKLPGRSEIVHTLARLLITSPKKEVRNPARALELMEGLTRGNSSVTIWETRALALAESGRWQEASNAIHSARQRAEGMGVPMLARRLANVEAALAAHRPFREPWPFAEQESSP